MLSLIRLNTLVFGRNQSATADSERTVRRYSLAAAGLILLVFIVNLTYLLWACPFDLASDEAHYWDWSRHLDWSYYSKGPLVAWLIHAGCTLFGDLSIALTGSLMPAVRFPAVVCSTAGLAGLYILTYRVFRRAGLALAVVAAAQALPPFAVCGVFMTIDAPLLCCWVWAAVFAERGMTTGGRGAWIGTAIAVGMGLLAKYTMALFPAALLACWLLHRDLRHHLRGAGLIALLAGGVLGGLPILIWNAQNDWVSIRHVYSLTGMADAAGHSEGGFGVLLAFLGGQFGLLLGYWFIALIAALIVFRPRPDVDAGLRLLWYLAVVPLGVCIAACLKTNAYLNWPAPAYVSGFILAMVWVSGQLVAPNPLYRRVAIGTLAVFITIGVGASLLIRFPQLVRPILAELADPPNEICRTPVRKYDPTVRLYGWRELAAEVDRARDRISREEGREPFVAGSSWQMCGELGCYCEGHPQVYSFGRLLNQRHSQYDLWRPNPVTDPEQFDGYTFVFVGSLTPDFLALFDRVSPPIHVLHHENGIPVNEWYVTVLHGYRAGAAKRVHRSGAY